MGKFLLKKQIDKNKPDLRFPRVFKPIPFYVTIQIIQYMKVKEIITKFRFLCKSANLIITKYSSWIDNNESIILKNPRIGSLNTNQINILNLFKKIEYSIDMPCINSCTGKQTLYYKNLKDILAAKKSIKLSIIDKNIIKQPVMFNDFLGIFAKNFTPTQNLIQLKLDSVKIEEGYLIRIMTNHPNLEYLRLSNCFITTSSEVSSNDSTENQICEIESIKKVELVGNCETENRNLQILKLCTQLQKLIIRSVKFTNIFKTFSVGSKLVTHLELSNLQDNFDNYASSIKLENFSNLKYLNMERCSIYSSKKLEQLVSIPFPSLYYFDISGLCFVLDLTGLMIKWKIPNIKEFRVSNVHAMIDEWDANCLGPCEDYPTNLFFQEKMDPDTEKLFKYKINKNEFIIIRDSWIFK